MKRFVVSTLVSAAMLAGPGYALAQEPASTGSFPDCPLLLEGQEGQCVRALQTYLNIDNYGYRLDEDGAFGESTRIAVLDFQGRNNLPADGNVGTATADALLARVDEVRREVATDSVPTPGPGAPLARGGAVGLGKSLPECVEDQLPKEAVQEGVFAWARKQGAKDAAKYLGKFFLPATVAEGMWCITFAMPE